ncbi:MAG: heme A synthase, partial [Thermoanaerobaculia bacterium]
MRGASAARAVAESGRRPDEARRARAIGLWLLACCVALAALVVVGGLTRLTRSGLSIVEWRPVTGVLPPLGEAAWEEAFAQYRETPEYRLVNAGMSLAQFKGIYGWEYAHRLLARAVGVLFLVPLLVFALRRRIDRALAVRLGGVFALGLAQGAMGWYMVASGLVDEPRVSHLRLAAHLGLALALFAALFWLALDQLRARRETRPSSARRGSLAALATALVALVFVQTLAGALVAGTHAGLAFSDFPLMGGAWIPPGMGSLPTLRENLLDNVVTLHFTHRALAWALLALSGVFLWRVLRDRRAPGLRPAAVRLGVALALQFALGVATVVLRVPLALAAAHQAGAVLVL